MTITLLLIGKTKDKSVQKLIDKYVQRLKHYIKFKIEIIPELKKRKNLTEEKQKIKEGESIFKKLQLADAVILLDEKGKEFTSVEFSEWIQKKLNTGKKRLVFIVGGPYGFSQALYDRADQEIAFSRMTFSHEMIRPFFAEQLYRSFTILRNEAYHHQ